jgi:hypothetical protein
MTPVTEPVRLMAAPAPAAAAAAIKSDGGDDNEEVKVRRAHVRETGAETEELQDPVIRPPPPKTRRKYLHHETDRDSSDDLSEVRT